MFCKPGLNFLRFSLRLFYFIYLPRLFLVKLLPFSLCFTSCQCSKMLFVIELFGKT